jgi:hypothetical protein
MSVAQVLQALWAKRFLGAALAFSRWLSGGRPIIEIQLLQETELTSTLALKVSTWHALAFKWSAGGRAIASRMQDTDEEDSKERERERERRLDADRQRAMAALGRELDQVGVSGDRFRIDALVQRDWYTRPHAPKCRAGSFCCHRLPPLWVECRYPFRLNFATEDPTEQNQLKRIIVAKFPALSDTFRYFSSLSTISENAFSMHYAEFRCVVVLHPQGGAHTTCFLVFLGWCMLACLLACLLVSSAVVAIAGFCRVILCLNEHRHLVDISGALNVAREQAVLDRIFAKLAGSKSGDPKCVDNPLRVML